MISQVFASLIEVAAVVLVYMMLHLSGVQLQRRWLIGAYSLTSLASLFAGFTLLFFRYRLVVYIFVLVQLLFYALFGTMAIQLITEDSSTVVFVDFAAEQACNRLVAWLGMLMCARLLIFTAQLAVIMFRLKIPHRDDGEGDSDGESGERRNS